MSISSDQRYALKLKAAYYLYEKDYTQVQVAEMLGISRVTLGRLIQEAKEEGIIHIEIVDVRNTASNTSLESEVKERFRLLDVRVVDCPDDDPKELMKRLGRAGARLFEQYVRNNMKIGCAWGRTLEYLVDSLAENKHVINLQIVTLLGGAGISFSEMQPNIMAQKLLDKYSGRGYVINAPCFCRTMELKDALMAEPHIQDVLNRAASTDVCLIGIGGMPEIGGNGLYETDAVNELIEKGAVGDVCANYFNRDGEICDTNIARRTITIDPNILKDIKRVIAVAGGENKGDSVLGALRGGYVNTLVTDVKTAKY
ncbi:MAG TPA: sugar-binding transcriptional regulator, partial [Feifaniaceae bacterium]|nr:sugar-binding transcriptional regulator [Feifaniaceae bacterium]